MTCIEVKTTGDAALPDEAVLVGHAADQIEQTATVLSNAVSGAGPFAAPRSEMLKEVLVRGGIEPLGYGARRRCAAKDLGAAAQGALRGQC